MAKSSAKRDSQVLRPLTDAQASLLRARVDHPAADWISPPMITGDWQERSPDHAFELLSLLGAHVQVDGEPLPLALRLDRVRTRQIACFGGALLVETQGQVPLGGGPVQWDPKPRTPQADAIELDQVRNVLNVTSRRSAREGIGCFILHGLGLTWLDGSVAPLHDLGNQLGKHLQSEAAKVDYTLVHLQWVHGDHGPFTPLVGKIDLSARLVLEEEQAMAARFGIRQLRFGRWPETGHGYAEVPLLYHTDIFQCSMLLDPNTGVLDMLGDRAMLYSLIARRLRFAGGLVLFGDPPIPPIGLATIPKGKWGC